MVDHTRYTDTEVLWETPSHFYVGIYSNDNGIDRFKISQATNV